MAIVRMTSFSLMTPKENRDSLLQALQRFGDVHFEALDPDGDGFLRKAPEESVEALEKQRDSIRQYIAEIERFEKASRRLVSRRERKDLIKRDIDVDTMTFAELERQAGEIDIVSLLKGMDEAEALHEGEAQNQLLYHIEPWVQHKLKDSVLVEIRDSRPIIGTVAAELEAPFAEDIRHAGHIYAIVKKRKDDSILFILKPALDQAENAEILAQKYHMKRRSVEAVRMSRDILEFRHKMDRMISRRNRTDGSLEKIARRKRDLMICHEYLENLLVRKTEAAKFAETDTMLIIKGWIPTDCREAFRRAVEEGSGRLFVLKFEDVPQTIEAAPVKLQNNRFASAFETITKMYATPRYNEVDPTPVFAPFYLLFFGMMLADVGYGLLMGAVMLLALTIFKLKPSTQRMARFLFYLSFSTILWGFVYGSFFGGMVPLPALINPNADYNRVLILSIGFGVLHLFVALGVKAYIYIRDGYRLYALFDVGFWYMVLLAGIGLVAQGMLPVLSRYQSVFLGALIGGMAGILLTNGRSAKTIPGKMAAGLYSLYGLTNYISDIVSYSRLMALGLAGGSIGIAINMIVRMLSAGGPLGVLVGAGVFIGVHLFNLFISGLSAYVHSSRLTYVEFFGKFYAGGGMDFTPFRAKNTYINVI